MKTLTIQEWELIFQIDKLEISDLKEWHQYAFNEGLADDSTRVELTEDDAKRLSYVEKEAFPLLWKNYNS